MIQIEIMCPQDGGDLLIDKKPSGTDLVCIRCGARYDFTPELQTRFRQQRMMMGRTA